MCLTYDYTLCIETSSNTKYSDKHTRDLIPTAVLSGFFH
jgi:hypothetical protein